MGKYMTKEQKFQIKEMLDDGVKKEEIASSIGVSLRTVYYEIKRGTINGQYDPNYSEEQYNVNKLQKGAVPILAKNRELAEYISKLILKEHKSPQQICKLLQRRKKYKNVITSPHTIYTAIDRGYIPNVTRESLIAYQTTVFNDAQLHIPKWVREKMNICNGDVFDIEVDGNKLIFTKVNRE